MTSLARALRPLSRLPSARLATPVTARTARIARTPRYLINLDSLPSQERVFFLFYLAG